MKHLLFLLFSLSFCLTVEVFFTPNIKQGETNSILLRSKNKLTGELYLQYENRKIPMLNIYYSPTKHVYRSLVGTDPKTMPGIKEISIIHKNKRIKNFSFQVTETPFETSYINLPTEKKEVLTNENLKKEGNLIGEKFQTTTKPALWRDNFIMPAKGRISSPYGAQRKYNKDNIAWWHRGVDIANNIGTPIYAPNDGKVILSDSFTIHGKTIMLDHGHGVVSVFNHLDTIDVKDGDFVNKGAKIATMGNTGNSTGPHLHWGLSINNIRVNPLQWVEHRFAPNYYR